MSVQELNRVHRRFIKISNSFKSAWTFHQFIQGLRKVFIEEGPADYQADFQVVYNDLKEVSKILGEATVDEADKRLTEVQEGLAPLVESLLAADEQVSPGLLRQFFQRVKNYDDNILSQLVKFYLYFRGEDGWNWDRLDKADYLSTKVCEEYNDSSDQYVLRDRTEVRETAEGFWAALEGDNVEGAELEELLSKIGDFRTEMSQVASIDELHDGQLVQRYRAFKHQLGDRFFQPKVLQAITETNLAVKNHVHQLYRRDEQRIIAEYQQVFDLERETPVDLQLRGEMTAFREAVERFEKRLQGDGNVRLEDLGALRERVRGLLPRLQPGMTGDSGPLPPPPEIREYLAEEKVEAHSAGQAVPADSYVEEQFRSVVAVLDDTNSTLEPRKVALQPEVFSLGIEAREVLAYRRIFSDEPCDRFREESILRAAALRVRIESDVEEILSILDDSGMSRDSPAFLQARKTLRHAEFALRRLEHLEHQAVLEAEVADVRPLMRLKVKLMRLYSGLWLLVYKD